MTTRNSISILVSLSVILVAGGCRNRKGEVYGEAPTMEPTSIAAILTNPADHQEGKVTVEGKIVTECPSGCWFEVKEGNAVLYVDIEPNGLAIPQEVGKTVTVEGKLEVGEGNRVRLIGSGVEVK